MKHRHIFMACLLSICANANAEWFLRGTHNAWAASQMDAAGTNAVQLKGVVFNAAGSVKFDRFGDWKESYGLNGGNIPVNAGTWDIKFFTDTKTWAITAPEVATAYHVRGTFNAWAEGTLMTRVGTTDSYESCINFTAGDANGGPRFKIDPNGAWGDAVPATDVAVSIGWVRIGFNSAAKTITTQQNLAANCGGAATSSSAASSSAKSASSLPLPSSVPSSAASSSVKSSVTSSSAAVISSSVKSSVASSSVAVVSSSVAPAATYHLRGTFNAWAEGTLLTRIGATDTYERCANFTGGDANGGPRFKVDPNGAWGDAIPASDFVVSQGWVKVTFNAVTKAITVQQNLSANCATSSSSVAVSSSVISSSVALSSSSAAISSSSVISSSSAAINYHLRGTFNAWAEGTLLARIGNTDVYERCANFTSGDTNGGPRFKVDPNGAWGDAVPASDFVVSQGWVKVTFNAITKAITVQQNLPANCAISSSSVAVSSSVISSSVALSSSSVAISSSSVTSSSSAAVTYHLRGTFNAWAEGTLLTRIGATDNYESCVNFTAGDSNGGPRFKIDPNGAWGDALPAADFAVTQGWVKIAFNSTTKAINVQQNLAANCGLSSVASSSAVSSSAISSSVASLSASSSSAAATTYHLRGTNNAWAEGTLLQQIGTTNQYEKCANFTAGDTNGGPRFKIDPNGAWGDAIPAADVAVTPGWVKIAFNSTTKVITTQQNLPANCGAEAFHLRGTHNAWAEGDLFTSVDGIQPVWSICRNFGPADAEENPRFKVDPNGGWGADAFPALDVAASGWTSVVIDGARIVSVTKDLAPNCAVAH